MNHRTTGRRATVSLLALAVTGFYATAAHAQVATPEPSTEAETVAPDAPVAPQDAVPAEEIVVTGFRQSLGAALAVKRQSVSAVDAIVAEDIAKFPDQNLAESLQRIPGISIQRDAGEGRAITVRGLGAQFTRVRLNGLETVATSTDGASANRDRAFDFNVFASELFSSLVVHKTAEASLDEGSLGAVVDLNTGNPLAGKEGFTLVGSLQASYNDLSKNWGPRAAGLISWKSNDGRLGASLSAAYSKTDNLEMGNTTGRWAQARFDSVDGTPCFYSSNSSATPVTNAGGFYRSSPACDKAALAFHPRIPRYGEVTHDRERLGVTGSVQFAPTERTKISIDALYSRFKEVREEKWGEVLFRSNERSIDLVNPVYGDNNDLIAGTFNDAWVRTEHYHRESKTEFYQVGATWDQDVGDSFRFTLLGGISRSGADIPVETTLIFDNRTAQNYRFDYSNMASPVLSFGTSMTDPGNFQLAEIRDRPSETVNSFRTAQLRTEWDVAEGFQIKAGGVYRRFEFDTTAATRDTAVCPAAGKDVVLGTITCTAPSYFGPGAVYGFPVAGLYETLSLGNAGQPAGTTGQWLIANTEKAAEFTNLYGRTLVPDGPNIRNVVEEVKGAYLEFDAKGTLFEGLDYAINAGTRYVRTSQVSTGLNNGATVTIDRDYEDWLPALNVALFAGKDVIVRAAVAKVMTRPTLGNLTPGGSVDSFKFAVNFGNPNLEPYRATSYDLAFEYYFAPQSIFSVALFKKDVDSFPVAVTRSGTYASTGLPLSLILPSSPAAADPEQRPWDISSVINGTGASLKGVEISLQAPFRFLPGVLQNFGGIVNATFVDSSAIYNVAGPAVTACVPNADPTKACTFGPNVPASREATLFGLSKRQFNATLYYEDSKFSARASVSYRSPYLDQNSAAGNVFEGFDTSVNVDMSMRYKLTPNVELSLEGTNLTDDYRYRFADIDARRVYENNHFGRTFLVGARFKM